MKSMNIEFGYLIHQMNSLQEVHKLKQNFQKHEVVGDKTSFFVIDPFGIPHLICLNIGF